MFVKGFISTLNMERPFISVIIPNFNHAPYLDERIQSVLNQTYRNFEIIILDDNSTDNSLEVINQYAKDAHVTNFEIDEENSGSPFRQWNKGLMLAKGDLIWIAESDDSCDVHLLESLVKEFENDDQLVFSFCRSRKMNESSEVEGVHFGRIKFPRNSICGSLFIKQYLLWRNYVVNASSVLFRKSVALQVDKSYQSFKGSGDWFFWVLLAERGNVSVVDEPLNYTRQHSYNTTTEVVLNGTSGIEARKIFDYIRSRKYNDCWTSIVYKSWKLYMCKYNMTY